MVGSDWFDLMWFVADRQGAQLRRYTGGVCVCVGVGWSFRCRRDKLTPLSLSGARKLQLATE